MIPKLNNMTLRHFRDKSKIRKRIKLKTINIYDYPVEIWYHILSFVEEADKRKVSLTCSYFNKIYQNCEPLVKLPLELRLIERYCLPIGIIRPEYPYYYNGVMNYGFCSIDANYFKITGPDPHVVILLYDIEEKVSLSVVSKTKFKDLLQNEIIIVKELIDCKFWYTKKFEGVYYVPGCNFREIDFAKKKTRSSFEEHYCFGAISQLTNNISQDSIISLEKPANRIENRQKIKTHNHTTKKNKIISNYSQRNSYPNKNNFIRFQKH